MNGPMHASPRAKRVAAVLAALALAYGAYAAFVTYSNGNEKTITIEAGIQPDGSMYYHCVGAETTPGACTDRNGHATVTVDQRDRVTLIVKTDDGRPHSHDFLLTGLAYLVWPAGVEMELESPTEQTTFTAYAAGEYKFICELKGHEAAGMWGTLIVKA